MIEKDILNWTYELVEKPLYICVVGSRMCGYPEKNSDWDVYVVCDNHDKKIKKIYQTENIFIKGEEIGIRVQPEKEVFESLAYGDARITEKLYSPYILFEKADWREKWKNNLNKEKILMDFLRRIKTGVETYEDKLKATVYAYRQAWTAWHYMKNSKIVLDYKTLESLYPGNRILEIGNLKKYRENKPVDLREINELIHWRIKEIENYLERII